MGRAWSRVDRTDGVRGGRGQNRRWTCRGARAMLGLAAAALLAGAEPLPGEAEVAVHFPSVPPEHVHTRALLTNALRYLDPAHKTIDAASGYPIEGWNQDPKSGLFLRSFTQLTAIGQCMEVLASIAAGQADTPWLSRAQARDHLVRMVASLRQDQADPQLSSGGLLVNFLDLASEKRVGPLASDVERQKFLDEFGAAQGQAIWDALQAAGWIAPRGDGTSADIKRSETYGWDHFDGPLMTYRADDLKRRILAILDQRVVLVVFGDNANLSASVAKTIGALSAPSLADDPAVATLRRDLEAFLENQRDGYARLHDPEVGLFYFGWDETKQRHFGWENLDGNWVTGHMDYLVNEFRGPATFVALRFGLPADAIGNLGFKMRPYRTQDGRELHVLAPWEGSAFQALGLELSLGELEQPSWRRLLENIVTVEVDYATRHGLPGFLSESYTGVGVKYTGAVGIPEITVSPLPRITDAASLYTLGAASTVDPATIERFLAANWPVLSGLLTEHGPWEGYNVTTRQPIQFQTTAHTLSLALGLLGTASEHMGRYLDSRGLSERLAEFFAVGTGADLLSDEGQVFAWDDAGAPLQSAREPGAFRVRGEPAGGVGIAFVTNRDEGENLSGGLLSLRYRSASALGPALIALKPAGLPPATAAVFIPIEITTRLDATGDREAEIQIPLPATPGLTRIKEVVLTVHPAPGGPPLDLAITGLTSTPIPTPRE